MSGYNEEQGLSMLRRFCAAYGLSEPQPLTSADRLTLARAALRSVAALVEEGRWATARAMVDDLALHLERLRDE